MRQTPPRGNLLGASAAPAVLVWACAALLMASGCASHANKEVRAIDRGRDLMELAQAADAAYEQGRYQDAVAQYQELAQSLQENADVWYRLGNAWFRIGNERNAAAAYERSLGLEPANPRAWHNLAIAQHRQALSAIARVAATAGPDEQVRQEGARVAGILNTADQAIRGGHHGSGLASPMTGPAPVLEETGDDDDATH